MMMKRIYICLLMLMLLSTATFAQKKGSPEYNAQLRATIIAMDSVLKYSRVVPDILMRFADEQCAKFKNDPAVMDSIAEAFYRFYNNEIYGERRYAELKRLHPEYSEVYLNEARMFHSIAYKRDEHGVMKRDSANLTKARVLKDSAKIKMPNSPEPYLLWMRLQAKFDEKDADDEIEALKRNFPNYPADLEAARYYDFIAKGDYNYLLVNALNHYEKVDLNTMKNSDLANFSVLCNRANSADIWQKGLTVAEFGINKFPDYATLYRFALWNAGKLKKWDEAERYGDMFIQLSDTIQKLSNDYKYLGRAKQGKKSYSSAIDMFRLQLAVPGISNSDYASALGEIVDCYSEQNDIEHTEQAYAEYEKFKKDHDMALDAADYYKIIDLYRTVMQDTTIEEKAYRMRTFEKMDSLCQLAVVASPKNTGLFNSISLNFLRSYLNDKLGEVDVTDPLMHDYAVRAIDQNLAYQATLNQFEIPNNDSYYLMESYYWLLEHYANSGSAGMQDAFKVAEKMKMEMPMAMELTELASGRKSSYQRWEDRANYIYEHLKKTYGKKR